MVTCGQLRSTVLFCFRSFNGSSGACSLDNSHHVQRCSMARKREQQLVRWNTSRAKSQGCTFQNLASLPPLPPAHLDAGLSNARCDWKASLVALANGGQKRHSRQGRRCRAHLHVCGGGTQCPSTRGSVAPAHPRPLPNSCEGVAGIPCIPVRRRKYSGGVCCSPRDKLLVVPRLWIPARYKPACTSY